MAVIVALDARPFGQIASIIGQMVPRRFCTALKESGNTASTMMLKDRDHRTIMTNIANQDDPAAQAILAFIARYSGLKLTAQ